MKRILYTVCIYVVNAKTRSVITSLKLKKNVRIHTSVEAEAFCVSYVAVHFITHKLTLHHEARGCLLTLSFNYVTPPIIFLIMKMISYINSNCANAKGNIFHSKNLTLS